MSTGEAIIKWSLVVLFGLRGLGALAVIDQKREPVKVGPAIAAAVIQALIIAAVVVLWD